MKSWQAQYRGTCGVCLKPIAVGADIAWAGEPGGPVRHTACHGEPDGSFTSSKNHQFSCRICGQKVLRGQRIVSTADPQLFHHAECAFAPTNDGN